MKVYVITRGDYSDYHIIAVCETKEIAKTLSMEFNTEYGLCNIEEYELNEKIPKLYKYFCRINKKTGEIILVEEQESSLDNDKGKDNRGNYYAMGATAEEAKKNAIDYRTKELARENNL